MVKQCHPSKLRSIVLGCLLCLVMPTQAEEDKGLSQIPLLAGLEQAMSMPVTPKPIQKKIPVHARKKFCLHMRGWAVPTQHVFSVLEGVLSQDTLDGKGVDMIRFWLDRGFGYAMSLLIEENYPKLFAQFVRMIRIEYKDTNAICPFRCTYRDYVELQKDLSMEGQKALDALCKPDCQHINTQFSAYDESFCECLVDQAAQNCELLSRDDQAMIQKAAMNQEVSLRDYEFRSNKNPLNNEHAAAVNERKANMLKVLNGFLSR